MGHAAVNAADHDRLETHLLRAVAQHPVLEESGNLLLRHAGLDEVERVLQRLLRNPLGGDHAVDLRLLLHAPQLHQQLGGGNQLLAGQFLLPAVVFLHGGVLLFKAQLLDAAGLDDLVGQVNQGHAVGALPDLRTGDPLTSGLNVAAVGEEIALLPGDDGHAGGGVELSGIQPVGGAGDHHGVQAVGVQLFRDLMESAHSFSCISFLRSV